MLSAKRRLNTTQFTMITHFSTYSQFYDKSYFLVIVAPHRVWRNPVPFILCRVVKCMIKISICYRHLLATTALKDK